MTDSHEWKDGDLYAGRPIRVLTAEEAAMSISSQAKNSKLLKKLYSDKGSKAAKDRMAVARAGKARKAEMRKAQQEQEAKQTDESSENDE